MCAGVVPQQPPINFAPDWIKRLGELRHVLRRAHVELPALNVTRQAGVRLRGQLFLRDRAHLLERRSG